MKMFPVKMIYDYLLNLYMFRLINAPEHPVHAANLPTIAHSIKGGRDGGIVSLDERRTVPEPAAMPYTLAATSAWSVSQLSSAYRKLHCAVSAGNELHVAGFEC